MTCRWRYRAAGHLSEPEPALIGLYWSTTYEVLQYVVLSTSSGVCVFSYWTFEEVGSSLNLKIQTDDEGSIAEVLVLYFEYFHTLYYFMLLLHFIMITL